MMKAAKPLKAHRDSGFKEQLPMILLLVPFFTFFFVFTVLPIISSMVLSLTSYDMLSAPKFTGIGNYMRMFVEDEVFAIVLKNTVALAIVVGPAGFLLAFLLPQKKMLPLMQNRLQKQTVFLTTCPLPVHPPISPRFK